MVFAVGLEPTPPLIKSQVLFLLSYANIKQDTLDTIGMGSQRNVLYPLSAAFTGNVCYLGINHPDVTGVPNPPD